MAAPLGLPSLDVPTPIPPVAPRAASATDRDTALALDIFRYTPVPTIVLDPSLLVVDVSDSYCRVSAVLDREQLLGCHLDAFCEKVTLPGLASSRNAIQLARDTARPHQSLVAHDGRTWSLRTVPIFSHGTLRCFLMELQDATEAHRRQLELEERMYSNETFRILVETVKDYAIFMLDPQGNVATWNAGAQAFKGYTKEEIIGKHFSSFYSQKDRDDGKPERELRDALRDGRVEDEGWRHRKDGSRFWANVVITTVYKGDVLLGYSKVTRDLTERKQAESELIAAYEESSKLKSEFLANMSHEIRTPMHGMLSALTLLLDTHLNPEQLELARVIEESGEVLLQVINDILDYSKLASGSFSISHDIISVPDIVQSVFRAQQKSCHVHLESNLDPQLPKAAEGDSLRYRQIVQNLLSNAVKFTETGYVRISATLQLEDAEAFTILTEVVDSGIGIPASASGSLFTPFTQFDNSATKKYKGTGLGLSICKSLAELMGGNIGFRPNPEGVGSIFWFTAKLKKVKQIAQLEVLQEKLEKLSCPSPKMPLREIELAAVDKRVLLAEDNPINQKVMLKTLARLGFNKVDLASDGREAVRLSMHTTPPYDLILMDINMPILDGVQATREIRKAGLHIPIIAMTANALKGQKESYIAKGMTAYIAKPVDRNLFVKLLLNCLKREEPG
ncbi:two-component system protein A [Lentithecium fluviatile CBS 122367]|uniref:Two-component system protein A n=1 Tax=Lentithecium fluviatile CBS 122367 TaxID=1168545 RepID=A0A6G1ILM6_9PLEO|nr:two-component system protein A [Lentithecium fluviatile CBS 122367]